MAEEYKFECRTKLNIISNFWIFQAVRTLMHGTQGDSLPVRKISKNKNFPTPTLMEEVKALVSGKNEFEDREKLFSELGTNSA